MWELSALAMQVTRFMEVPICITQHSICTALTTFTGYYIPKTTLGLFSGCVQPLISSGGVAHCHIIITTASVVVTTE